MDEQLRNRSKRSLAQRLQDCAILMILVVVQLIFLAALLVDLALFLPRVPKALCEIPIGMAGLVAVACTIRSFVQKLNRRDDPRHAERPLDAP